MVKGRRIPVRVSNEEDAAFKEAAASEGLDVSKWLRALAHRRINQLRENPPPASPFTPGYGIPKED